MSYIHASTTANTLNINSISASIHQRALEVSSRYKKAEAELLDVLERVEQHQVFIEMGHPSLFQYCVNELALAENITYNLISVMRKSREIPELKNAVQEGSISLNKARRIAPVLTLQNKNEWLEKAQTLTSRQLEKEIVKDHPKLATREHASYVTEFRIKLELGLFEADMLALRKAQTLVSHSLSKSASLEDTIKIMTEFYLRHKDPVKKAERSVVKGLKTESAVIEKPTSNITSTPDSKTVFKIKEMGGVHTRSPIPAGILHQVNLRDQRKCTHINKNGQRCNQNRWIHVHHLKPVAVGGKNNLDNLATLCSTHHRWAHAKAAFASASPVGASMKAYSARAE